MLPYLAARDHRLLKPETKRRRAAASDASDGEYSTDDEDDEELENIRDMVRGWKAEAARDGRPLKLPTSKSSGKSHILSARDSAVHAEEYLDGRARAVCCYHGFHILHH